MKKNKNRNATSTAHTTNRSKWTFKKVIRKIGKVTLGIGACVLVTEGSFIAANAAVDDVKLIHSMATYKNKPVTIKTGKIFKKRKTVVINPVTGKMSPYTGKKVK